MRTAGALGRMCDVRRNSKGRGLYAAFPIEKGAWVGKEHLLVFPSKEATDDSVIHRYTFEWSKTKSALVLGIGSLINHSFTPNVYCHMNRNTQTIEFFAYRDIAASEELLLNYNGEPNSKRKVAFEVKK